MLNTLRNKILVFLVSIGPGLFLLGYNIGTGSVTTMATAGASYGLKLTWAILLSCLFTYFLVITFGKYTIVTGKTALLSFKERFGKPVTLFVMFSLLISELASCMGIMGVVTEVVQEWSRPLTLSGNGIPPVFSALFFAILLYFLIWQGKYSFFEKVLAIFVGLMAICFLATMFMTSPEPVEYAKGLLPLVPDEKNAFLIVSGMVGTTMGGILFVVRSIIVAEKGWNISDIRLQKRDAAISCIMMFVLSIAVMACAAGVLYPEGYRIDSAIDLIRLLEPLAGKYAAALMVAGIVSAGLSSLFPILLLAPWLLADYRGVKSNLKSGSSRLLVLMGLFASLVIPVFGGRPVFIMIASQSMAIIATPLVILLIAILLNDRKLMGAYKFTPVQNGIMFIIMIFTVYMAGAGIIGLIS